MILFRNTSSEVPIEIGPSDSHLHIKQVQTYNPWSKNYWPSSLHASIINLFTSFIYHLFGFCASQIESGFLWRHKFGKLRTIITMLSLRCCQLWTFISKENPQNNCIPNFWWKLLDTQFLFIGVGGGGGYRKIHLLWPFTSKKKYSIFFKNSNSL